MRNCHIQASLFIIIALILPSCDKLNDLFSAEDKEVSDNESAQESTMNEIDDMATSILNSSPISGSAGGRTAINDDRFGCDGINITFSDVNADKTTGTVTINFPPAGCTDKKGNVRKGTIVVKWTGGRWFKTGSTSKITVEDYSINGIDIKGTQVITCTGYTAQPLTVTWAIAANHTAIWPDGTKATRTVNKNKKWEHTAADDVVTITNAPSGITCAEGTNRHGNSYRIFITTPLVYLGSCAHSSKVFIPISGEKVITHSSSNGKNKSLTINYGDGGCDNTYVATSGTVSKTLTAKNDSSVD